LNDDHMAVMKYI